MGERGYLSSVAGEHAAALYAQDRLDDAQQLTEEAKAAAAADDIDAQARWRATRAKVLARRGQFAAAQRPAKGRSRPRHPHRPPGTKPPRTGAS